MKERVSLVSGVRCQVSGVKPWRHQGFEVCLSVQVCCHDIAPTGAGEEEEEEEEEVDVERKRRRGEVVEER